MKEILKRYLSKIDLEKSLMESSKLFWIAGMIFTMIYINPQVTFGDILLLFGMALLCPVLAGLVSGLKYVQNDLAKKGE